MDDCPHCSGLQQAALDASKVYHERLEGLEAAHICHNLDVLMLLSTRLESARQGRDAAIVELTNHEATHAQKKPADVLRMSKRQSA